MFKDTRIQYQTKKINRLLEIIAIYGDGRYLLNR